MTPCFSFIFIFFIFSGCVQKRLHNKNYLIAELSQIIRIIIQDLFLFGTINDEAIIHIDQFYWYSLQT